jgi:deoxyribodipyrimidine photo-lyase
VHNSIVGDFQSGLVWFRRDLRLSDQHALYMALKHCHQVYCAFVFDTDILDPLQKEDRRVEFIQESLVILEEQMRSFAHSNEVKLITLHGQSHTLIPKTAAQLGVQAVFSNHDDEPNSLKRDAKVRGQLAELGISMFEFKDHVIFERNEVLTQTGNPYGVFTPYKNAWLKKVTPDDLKAFDISPYAGRLAKLHHDQLRQLSRPVHSLSELGFKPTNLKTLPIPCGATGGATLFKDFLKRIDQYHDTRDYPSVKGPSYLGVHLRFGTVSIREMAREALSRTQNGSPGAQVWLSELIWRDFYAQILHHHPRVVERAFKPDYDKIQWEDDQSAQAHFEAWCNAQTGYPIVDAAMRQINSSGYMHNRLRMVVASFLVKDLGIDWRWGESYFATHLLDFDLASNNGGWQWASSSGCDAQPYFRIFNPVSQSERFDPKGQFIKRYLPELSALSERDIHSPWEASPIALQGGDIVLGKNYPRPIVDHAKAREKTLMRYSVVKSNKPAFPA